MGNRQSFADALVDLQRKVLDRPHNSDFRHLRRLECLGRGLTMIGFATAWLAIHPIAIVCISLGSSTRWMIAHHVLHRAYDHVPGIPRRYTSRAFAQGWRRYIDWFDWIYPAGWTYEHNVLHHFYTGEADDPDLVERHVGQLKRAPIPRCLKYLAMLLIASVWKIIYYAPSTFSTLNPRTLTRKPLNSIRVIAPHELLRFDRVEVRQLWRYCYLPYGVWHFCVIPMGFAMVLGPQAGLFVFVNRLLAELLSNVHSFFVILPNHTAPDVPRFDFHYADRTQFFVTQIHGTVNYKCGHVLGDYLQFWLNYQIEHHLFPDLPILAYREIQPLVSALCERHRIPYHQESLYRRFRGMAMVFVGERAMPHYDEFWQLPVSRPSPRSQGSKSNDGEAMMEKQ